jgi:3-keto-disaccharide hydrolase
MIRHSRAIWWTAPAAALLLAAGMTAQQKNRDLGYDDTPVIPGQKWRVHDVTRPRPRAVTPGSKPGDPPSDAIVLFDGKDLSRWVNSRRGVIGEAAWKVENGCMEVAPGTGDLITKEKFADAQFHVEWAAPAEVKGASQARGNSGFLIMSRYEIQILDSFDNPTYADGGAGSIYGQWPPLVNASRPPGEWQTYDIVFEAPRFEQGKLAKPAFVTVFHNGVLLHNRKEIQGPMAHAKFTPYSPHNPEEPLMLQDHHDKVRYRNIWVRRLAGYDQP